MPKTSFLRSTNLVLILYLTKLLVNHFVNSRQFNIPWYELKLNFLRISSLWNLIRADASKHINVTMIDSSFLRYKAANDGMHSLSIIIKVHSTRKKKLTLLCIMAWRISIVICAMRLHKWNFILL